MVVFLKKCEFNGNDLSNMLDLLYIGKKLGDCIGYISKRL